MASPSVEKHYDLRFEVRPGYLYAFVDGDSDSYEISQQYWSEIANECGATNATRVLVVENIAEETSVAEAFQLASELPEMGFNRVKVAFVDTYTEQEELNKFSELVALNRGFNTKIFNNEKDAERWLLAD